MTSGRIPADDMELLHAFRSTHPSLRRIVCGAEWSYIATARHADGALLLLPGALGWPETSFQYVLAFEPAWRVIACTYPPSLPTIKQVVTGLTALLDAEGIDHAHVVGGSYSGLVAQYLAAIQPDRVASLLLSNTGAPQAKGGRRVRVLRPAIVGLPEPWLLGIMRRSIHWFLPAATPAHRFWRAYFEETIPWFTKADLLQRIDLMIDMTQPKNAECCVANAYQGAVLIAETPNDRAFSSTDRAELRRRYPRRSSQSSKGKVTRRHSIDHKPILPATKNS
ncbi:MAG: hypothetical protein IPK16_22240 [Anaerolineales bacterium]|nr:hypothetical protein [Anaerolineales bacterium]